MEIPDSLKALTGDFPATGKHGRNFPHEEKHGRNFPHEGKPGLDFPLEEKPLGLDSPGDDRDSHQATVHQQLYSDGESTSSCVVYEELPGSSSQSLTIAVEINHSPSTSHQDTPVTATEVSQGANMVPEDDEAGESDVFPGEERRDPVTRDPVIGGLVPRTASVEEFPPDKQEVAGEAAAGGGGGKAPAPARPSTTPLRSRSVIYNSVMSDRSTPSLPSLSHSYETLNGSDSAEISYKAPMRPAPPIPTSSAGRLGQERGDRKPRDKERDKKAMRQRRINSLKKKICWKEQQLEEQLLLELDMYQDIAVARGTTYDTLNKRMDRCQANIETISDQIQQLQACLADEEAKQEEEKIDELTRREEYEQIQSQLRAKKLEEEKKKEEERRKKNREERENVIRELIITEGKYCNDLTLTYQAFGLDNPSDVEEYGVDVKGLFGNIQEVISTSERFYASLQELSGEVTGQLVGSCFLAHSQTMKTAYTEYCLQHEKAVQLLERYEADPNTHKIIQKGVEVLRTQISCFDMGSILIKPVQRILKYPLILNQLNKCTEDDSRDKPGLLEAKDIMSDIATFINETKRKKDIVEKYRVEGDSTISRRISKLNMHSIGKKSSRISQKFLNTIGMDSLVKDEEFEELERQFSHLSSSVSVFLQNAQKVREHIHETTVSHFNMAENIADLYSDRQGREVERFRSAHRHIISTGWNQYNNFLEEKVMKPLQQLLEAFNSPSRLIQKRCDKQLDFSAASQRSEKNKDQSKTRTVKDELESAQTTFLALNSQLVTELPILIQLSQEVYTDCVRQFVLARKLFLGRVTKELLQLMDIYKRRLPLLASNSGDILEVFLIKHSLVANQFGRFSFATKTFRPEDKPRGGSPARAIGQTEHSPQNSNQRTFLRGKYAATKLYQANKPFQPTNQLEIWVSVGDLLGVIQEKDPTGNRSRWFCDNGVSQGFVDAAILSPLGHSPEGGEAEPCQSLESHAQPEEKAASEEKAQCPEVSQAKPVAVVAPYDEVAEDCPGKKPTRRAPPVPHNKILGLKPQPANTSLPNRSLTSSGGTRHGARDPEQMSHHSYEEIAASELNSETQSQQDLSPIYEEIPGGSRSSMSSGSGSGRSMGSPRGRFYYALYQFVPEPHEVTMMQIKEGEVVRVIQVAGEWWYVENRHAVRGYVPAAYLKIYTS